MENYMVYLRQLNLPSMLLRLMLALTAGGLIGFERERKRRPAGFRTYMLVAMGAALTMILGQYLVQLLSGDWAALAAATGGKTDVSRLGAQVINGVGFLGAGTVIVTGRQEVKGLTTAAGLWAAACMGLAVGAGFYEGMIIGFVLIIICMNLLPLIEGSILSSSRNMNVYVELDSIDHLGALLNSLKSEGIKLHDVDITKQQHEHLSQINALFDMQLPRRRPHTEILATLSMYDGILTVEEV